MDTYTEEEILRRLREVMRQRTSLIVSHRVSTVRGADQILVLDDGRIVERGTHDELIRHGGLYAALSRSSCSRKSSRRPVSTHHDDDVLGKAYDARLMRRLLDVPAPVPAAGGAGDRRHRRPLGARSWRRRTSPRLVIDEYIPAGDLSGLGVIAAVYLAAHPGCRSASSSRRPGRCR